MVEAKRGWSTYAITGAGHTLGKTSVLMFIKKINARFEDNAKSYPHAVHVTNNDARKPGMREPWGKPPGGRWTYDEVVNKPPPPIPEN
jgi:hypothetical protein